MWLFVQTATPCTRRAPEHCLPRPVKPAPKPRGPFGIISALLSKQKAALSTNRSAEETTQLCVIYCFWIPCCPSPPSPLSAAHAVPCPGRVWLCSLGHRASLCCGLEVLRWSSWQGKGTGFCPSALAQRSIWFVFASSRQAVTVHGCSLLSGERRKKKVNKKEKEKKSPGGKQILSDVFYALKENKSVLSCCFMFPPRASSVHWLVCSFCCGHEVHNGK